LKDGTGPKEFHWLHIPTMKEGVTVFSEYHAKEAGTTLEPFMRMSQLECLFLVDKWNASGTDWKYWL
jgi:hypothetical protein